jgi:exodeoxyribonuclease VII small subunit
MAENTEEFSIEKATDRLEAIAKILEDPETSLKDSLEIYAEGVRLIKQCKDVLMDVEKEIIILSKDGEAGV